MRPALNLNLCEKCGLVVRDAEGVCPVAALASARSIGSRGIEKAQEEVAGYRYLGDIRAGRAARRVLALLFAAGEFPQCFVPVPWCDPYPPRTLIADDNSAAHLPKMQSREECPPTFTLAVEFIHGLYRAVNPPPEIRYRCLMVKERQHFYLPVASANRAGIKIDSRFTTCAKSLPFSRCLAAHQRQYRQQ